MFLKICLAINCLLLFLSIALLRPRRRFCPDRWACWILLYTPLNKPLYFMEYERKNWKISHEISYSSRNIINQNIFIFIIMTYFSLLNILMIWKITREKIKRKGGVREGSKMLKWRIVFVHSIWAVCLSPSLPLSHESFCSFATQYLLVYRSEHI